MKIAKMKNNLDYIFEEDDNYNPEDEQDDEDDEDEDSNYDYEYYDKYIQEDKNFLINIIIIQNIFLVVRIRKINMIMKIMTIINL
jgi:hypothetical protein